MTVPEFQTQRFLCRKWQRTDLDAIYTVYADKEGARWVGDGQPITRAECEQWMDVTLTNYQQRGYGMFALIDRENGETVGFCGLVHPGGQEEPEIKYAFLRAHWGKGFASEVVPAMLRYASNTHKLKYVIATVASENVASQRVLTKSGMGYVKALDDDPDTLLYEWRALD